MLPETEVHNMEVAVRLELVSLMMEEPVLLHQEETVVAEAEAPDRVAMAVMLQELQPEPPEREVEEPEPPEGLITEMEFLPRL